jgi:hypothetical protein
MRLHPWLSYLALLRMAAVLFAMATTSGRQVELKMSLLALGITLVITGHARAALPAPTVTD